MILGNENIKSYFQNILKTGNFVNAYGFFGQRGVGKYTYSKYLATKIIEKNNLAFDLLELKPKKETFALEDMENIEKFMSLKSSGDKKIIIVDKADGLSEILQNKLLKSIEETPLDIIVFFITENPYMLLPTLRSRLENIYFSSLDTYNLQKIVLQNEIYSNIKKQGISENGLKYSLGSVYNYYLWEEKDFEKDIISFLEMVDNFSIKYKSNLVKILKKWNMHASYLMDLILFKECKKENPSAYLLESIISCKERLLNKQNQNLVFDILVINLATNKLEQNKCKSIKDLKYKEDICYI